MSNLPQDKVPEEKLQNDLSPVRIWIRRLILGLLLAFAAASLVRQSLDLRQVRYGLNYVASLGLAPWKSWAISFALLAWASMLWFLTRRSARPFAFNHLLDRSLPATALLFGLALTPFWTRISAHLLLPAFALLVLLILLASLRLCPESCAAPVERIEKILAKPWMPFVVAALVAFWYFILSYYRHHEFGSGSRDMGLFFQSVWLLSTGHAPLNTLIFIPTANHSVNAFADHLEFIDFLMVPLVWIWRDAGALLLGQALIVGSGVAALMRIVQRRSQNSLASLWMGAAYFVSLPIAQAVQFDWNPTTLALGFLLWAFDFADRRRYGGMLVALLLVGLCKENLLLYVAAFGLYLALEGHSLRLAFAIMGLSGILFVVEIKLIFPLFRAQGFRHFYFHQLGKNLAEVAVNIIAAPYRALALLWTPERKINGLLLPFSASAWLGLLAPAALVVALPSVAERFLSEFRNTWWGFHYGAPSAGIALVAAAQAIGKWSPLGQQRFAKFFPDLRLSSSLAFLVFASSLAMSFLGPWGASDLFQLEKPYLPPKAERANMRAALAVVPEDPEIAVAAQDYLVAHLAARKQIFELTEIARSQIVVVDLASNPWPLSSSQLHQKVQRLMRDQQWKLIFCRGQALVFDRRVESQAIDSSGCAALR